MAKNYFVVSKITKGNNSKMKKARAMILEHETFYQWYLSMMFQVDSLYFWSYVAIV